MAEYQYKGKDRDGKFVSGDLEAQSEGEVRMILREKGIRPTSLAKKGTVAGALSGGGQTAKIGNVPDEAVVIFTRQLQVMIGSGIPLIQGLEILQEQVGNANLKAVIIAVKERVAQGGYLWESLSGYPHIFPKLYVALVRAGEASGSLEAMLKRVSRYLEDYQRMLKMVKGAMMYPVIVISIGIGVISLMLVFVIPKFEEMLRTSNQELPLPTQLIINMSHFLINNIWVIAGAVGILFYLGDRYRKSAEGRAVIDRLQFRLPFFGELTQKSGVARFARTLQTLLASGVNLIDAIDICKATIDNAVLEEAVGTIRAEVESGKTLGMVINKIEVFPRMAVQMITVGEATGNLDKMLEKVADFYEEEVETVVSSISRLIEPFVLVFLGSMVGGIMIAMYLPIFKLAGGD